MKIFTKIITINYHKINYFLKFNFKNNYYYYFHLKPVIFEIPKPFLINSNLTVFLFILNFLKFLNLNNIFHCYSFITFAFIIYFYVFFLILKLKFNH